MRVLVVGSGGREQAIAWACRRCGHNVALATSLPGDTSSIDLVIPGPESLIVAGIADECASRNVPCFGPSAALARLESSKRFARELATALGIPGPLWAGFSGPQAADAAIDWWRRLGAPVVVKADGLAAGKGVVIPADDDETETAIRSSSGPFLLERQLHGPECSLLALCDGHRAVALPLVQDHKRIGEGDAGPNTGGMGAYAPAPVSADPDELVAMFVQPLLDHLAAAGTPYVGVLFAGLMLTADGPRLIEYNCRFGDPEAQTVLPLMDDDLAELALLATSTGLAQQRLSVRNGAACTVVAAAAGYPGDPVTGTEVTIDHAHFAAGDDTLLFPAGLAGGCTTGGRVLSVTGVGADLGAARRRAYEGIEHVAFEGMQVRRDIAWRAPGAAMSSYAEAGVDIDEGNRAVALMRDAVERTHGAEVVGGLGGFGGAFSAKSLLSMADPVLVASTDGVGTKVELAACLGRFRGIGHDIVNHCVNDVLVQAATPLFFLDYVASARLDAAVVAEVVTGMAEACEAAGCTLLGGETAEMPGVYVEGAFDVAGTLVGAVDRHAMLPRGDVAAGDVLIGVGSSGPHTNGYSLLRRLFEWIPLDATPAGFDLSLGETLLEPHRNYLPVLESALESGAVKALAHITGGGLFENLPRVLPPNVAANVDVGSWPAPPLFALVQELATGMGRDELYRTLNMGIGMVVICAPGDVAGVQAVIPEPTWQIGTLTRRTTLDTPQVTLLP